MDDIKVTVYLSTYNQEPYVAQALESILMQKTDFKFEIIAADDCSTDRTQEIILDYQKRFPGMIETYFTNPNVGGCKKLTDCIDRGLFRGEYLSYLEGDDYWIGDNRLQTLMDFLRMHPEYAGIAHQRALVDEEGNFLGVDLPDVLLDKVFTIDDFLDGYDYADFGTLFRNYFKLARNKYHGLLQASRNVCDFQDMFIIQDFGPVFITSQCFGAYRTARKPGASNYNSITTQTARSVDHINVCRKVEQFYNGVYDLSPMIQREKKKILHEIITTQDKNGFKVVRDNLSSKEIISNAPELLYLSLRGKRLSESKYLWEHLNLHEKCFIAVGTILYTGMRTARKIMGKPLSINNKKRGYLKK